MKHIRYPNLIGYITENLGDSEETRMLAYKVFNCIGSIQKQDIGKAICGDINGVIQVESQEQFEKRKSLIS